MSIAVGGARTRVISDNGLTIVLLGLTIATVAGMFLTGWQVNNEEVTRHGARHFRLQPTPCQDTSSRPSLKTGRASSCKFRHM